MAAMAICMVGEIQHLAFSNTTPSYTILP